IEKLFTEGKAVGKYPLRLGYMEVENAEEPSQLSVSVSKKYFKEAVDRNRFKRLLRDTYRLNQHLLKENLTKPYVFMLLYQSSDALPFEDIKQKTVELFEKFHKQQNQN